MKKSKEINEQIKFGLDSIDKKRKVEIKLKDLLLIFKSIREFRRFFHNSNHYPLLTDIHTYIGDTKTGMYSILSKLYSKLYKYIPEDLENTLGDEDDKLTPPNYPYYYNLKKNKKYKISAGGNIEPSAYYLIKELGYDISKKDGYWIMEDCNSKLIASSPLELLGLVTLLKTKGNNWKASDDIVDQYINIDQ